MNNIKKSIDTLVRLKAKYHWQLTSDELQALNDGISALKTIDDMYIKGKEIK